MRKVISEFADPAAPRPLTVAEGIFNINLKDARAAMLTRAEELFREYKISVLPHPFADIADSGQRLQWLADWCKTAETIPEDDDGGIEIALACGVVIAWARMHFLCTSDERAIAERMPEITVMSMLIGQLHTIMDYERHGIINRERIRAATNAAKLQTKQRLAAIVTNSPKQALMREAMIRCALNTEAEQLPPKARARNVIAEMDRLYPDRMLKKEGKEKRSGPSGESLHKAIRENGSIWWRILSLVHGENPTTQEDEALRAEIDRLRFRHG